MTSTTRHRLAPLVVAGVVAALLTGCSAPDAATSVADPTTAASTGASASGASAAPAAGDLCTRIGYDRLNTIMKEGGEPLSAAAAAGPDCRFTGSTGTYLVSQKTESFDTVLAGRSYDDQTAGAKAGWLKSERLFLLQHGDGTIAVTALGTGAVDLSTVMSVAYSVDALLP